MSADPSARTRSPKRAPSAARDYAAIARHITRELEDSPAASRADRMRLVTDTLWDALHQRAVSWIGFYIADESQPEDRRLILGPRRDKPACSPLALHGVCGQAYTSGRVRIVRDVKELGGAYVACDPRDRSEIVIPLFEKQGGRRVCWGVLDLDSWDVGAFDEEDSAGLVAVLRAAGFDCVSA